ncbi:MAG: thioredoxin family protein [Myxococcota bacterium]
MSTTNSPRIVSREEWLEARKLLLAEEKELTRLRDRLAAKRRALPWVEIEKQYVFAGPQGRVTLADLFDGRSQLFVKHFMMAPGQVAQCVGCSLEVDHLEGVRVHLENHDVSYAAVARAPIDEIEAVRKRMGWRFPWVSSCRSDFNRDFHVSFSAEELARGRAFYNYEYVNPGLQDRSGDSVFARDDSGRIFHTYSSYGRGGEEFLGIYRYLDATPKGRGEQGPYNTLADWVRPKNMYGQGGVVEGSGRYHEPGCACVGHPSGA